MTDDTRSSLAPDHPGCWSRRQFLYAGGTVIGAGAVVGYLSACDRPVRVASHPKQQIGRISQLIDGVPHAIQYPGTGWYASAILVKLGVPADGGVGPQRDIVAFSTLCTHQGGPLGGLYDHRYRLIGPCPMHLTTFDLTRRGMVVSGHATEGLPQIVLETEGDTIHAVAVMGLIYGYHDNDAAYGRATT